MEIGLKIRGIYATALTRFFIEHNLAIVSPSGVIKERFRDYQKFLDHTINSPDMVEVGDLDNHHGIFLRGNPDQRNFVVELIRERFFDVIFRQRKHGQFDFSEIDFPYLTKSALDELRNGVVPTVPNHHRLKLISSEYVDLMEKMQLAIYPEKRETVGRELEKRLIWEQFEKGEELAIEHVKLNGEVISLTEGEIIEVNTGEKKLILQRKLRGRGEYDGLDLSIKSGDYAITELREGDWFYRHMYYRQNGSLIGEYYNINTPIEFYPDQIRYYDLEIDVIKWPDGMIKMIDTEELDHFRKSNCIGGKLADKAIMVAQEIKKRFSINSLGS